MKAKHQRLTLALIALVALIGAGVLAVLLALGASRVDDVELPDVDADRPYGGGW